jgi:hypothetical protein
MRVFEPGEEVPAEARPATPRKHAPGNGPLDAPPPPPRRQVGRKIVEGGGGGSYWLHAAA